MNIEALENLLIQVPIYHWIIYFFYQIHYQKQ